MEKVAAQEEKKLAKQELENSNLKKEKNYHLKDMASDWKASARLPSLLKSRLSFWKRKQEFFRKSSGENTTNLCYAFRRF